MSIDKYCYVTSDSMAPSGRKYNYATSREILAELNSKQGKDHGKHTVYIMQHGVEYLYSYQLAEHAQEDFNTWRAEPCESIQLKLDGQWQPEGRVELTEEQIKAWQEKRAKEEAEEAMGDDLWNGFAEEAQ